MAHHVEPMDVDCMDSDSDNKENTYHHSNVLPCTEKGYEELDVSELNMKLRYSMTPASSPMSKSYTTYVDNRNLDSDTLNCSNDNGNLTRSLNSTITRNDSVIKSLKSLPLQSIPTEQFSDGNGNPAVLRELDSTSTAKVNLTVTLSGTNEGDENISLPSSSSSLLHTPEATSPTHDKTKNDGSPIMRGLKSMLNIFRSSQSPIPPGDSENNSSKQVLSPADLSIKEDTKLSAVASTPIAAHRTKEGTNSKRSSPLKESIVFNDDLEKELSWKDETTVFFSEEKIPVHKLFFQQKPTSSVSKTSETLEKSVLKSNLEGDMNTTVEYMDISYNESIAKENTLTELQTDGNKNEASIALESDSEFVDCETTFTKNETEILDDMTSVQTKDPLDIQTINTTNNIIPVNEITTSTNESTLSDVTCTLIDEDHKNDVTIPSDYSDYSKETADILSELEKLEEITSQKIESLDTDKVQETTYTQKNIPDMIHDTTNTVSEENKETRLETTISLEKFDVTKDVSGQKSAIDITLEENKPDLLECKENILNMVNEIPSQVENVQEQIAKLENQNSNNTQTVEASSLDSIEPVNEIVQQETTNSNIAISQDLSQTNTNIENAYVAVSNVSIDLNLHVNSSILKSLESTFVQEVNNTEYLNMPESKTLQATIEETLVSQKENVDGTTDVLPSVIQETLNLPHIEKPYIPLPNEELPKENREVAPSDILSVSPKELPIPQIEKPSDIPLPDEDDIDKEVLVDEVLTTLLKGTANETQTALDTTVTVTNTHITCEDQTQILTTEVNEVKEDINLPEVLKSPHKLAEMSVLENSKEIILIQNTDKTDLSINNSQEIMSENLTDKNMIVPELSNVISETAASSFEIEENIPKVEELNVTATVEKVEITSESKTNEVVLPEVIPPSNPVLDHTYEYIADNVTEVIKSHSAINTLDGTDTNDNFEQTQNNTQTIEPMDITFNDTLNQTHDLPDLVNQTITMTEDSVANIVQTSVKSHIPKQEQTTNSGNVEIANVPTSFEVKTIKEADILVKSDLKLETEPVIVSNTEQIVESIKQENENIVTELSVDDASKSNFENTENETIDTNTQSSEALLNKTEILLDVVTTQENKLEINVDEEIIASENNSPYVSLMAGIETAPVTSEENFEQIENPFVTESVMPSSPPIVSKGYNFNFDEMDDPFATKTKIRMSPPLDTPTKSIVPEIDVKKPDEVFKQTHRRRSQPAEKKRPALTRKKLNSTFDAGFTTPVTITDDEAQNTKSIAVSNNDTHEIAESVEEPARKSAKPCTETFQAELNVNIENSDESIENKEQKMETLHQVTDENKSSIDSITSVSNETKIVSSSEQSTYFSAGGSSTDSLKTKNVFNLPEIDDINFNPFATKCKMRQSPTPDMVLENPFATRSKIKNTPDTSLILTSQSDLNTTVLIDKTMKEQEVEKIDDKDKMETELMEKDTSLNINTTSSSKCTDNQNLTVREVNTEDEDTEEGPFLEVDDIDKMSDFDDDNTDMMQFNDPSAQGSSDNVEGEMFIDAEAFEFLLNQNKSNVVADSGKESLFLKFDPLFAKRISSDGVLAALHKIQKKQSTPTKPARASLKNEASPIAGPSTLNITYEGDNNVSQESNEDLNITVSKPMMVVTPAVNPAVTPRNKSVTPTRSNRRSITFTSPAIAVIDRLLSMSGNNSLLGQDTTSTQPNREQNEADLALTQLRELLAEKEISVYNLRSESKELKDRLASMETQVKILESDGQERLKKINELNERLAEKTRINKSMAAVVEEYERTIASLISETELDKKRNAEERIRLINERDEQTAHLASMEVSFSDLHSKYEKSKQVILACKANEDTYKKSIKEFTENLNKMQTNYELLKQHATSKLNHANQELEKINRAHEAEVVKLNAMIKRKDLHITSLEETLAQKTKANEELTAICDELINKVG